MRNVLANNDAGRVTRWLPGRCTRAIFCLALTLVSAVRLTEAAEIEGFTEPYRVIDVAASDWGILTRIHVREGQPVTKGQCLAELNAEVLKISLEIAAKAKLAQGQLQSAEAELRLRTDRLKNLKTLLADQHASQEEVTRALEEKQVAVGRFLAVQEALETKALEFERVMAQLKQRKVYAPTDGIVTHVPKEVGEFLAPTDPVLLTLVELDPLLASFSVPAGQIGHLAPERTVNVRVGPKATVVEGVVDFVSPVINAQSATVTVKVRLPNSDGQLLSGEKCSLLTEDPEAKVPKNK